MTEATAAFLGHVEEHPAKKTERQVEETRKGVAATRKRGV